MSPLWIKTFEENSFLPKPLKMMIPCNKFFPNWVTQFAFGNTEPSLLCWARAWARIESTDFLFPCTYRVTW